MSEISISGCDFQNQSFAELKKERDALLAQVDQLKKEKQQVQNRFNFLLDKNIRNEADYASLKLKVGAVLLKWKKESEHADRVASEDFVQNVLDACIDDLEGVIRGANG